MITTAGLIEQADRAGVLRYAELAGAVVLVVFVVVLLTRPGLVLRLLGAALWGLFVLLVRFATGAPLRGYDEWDSTFFKPAPPIDTDRVSHRRRVPRSTWSRWPGYKRMAARWLAITVLLAGVLYPWWTAGVLGTVLVTAAAVAAQRHRAAAYERTVLQPLWDALAPVLGVDAEATAPREWVSIPADPEAHDAAVLVGLPTQFHPTDAAMSRITDVVNHRVSGGPWVLHLHPASYLAEYRHASDELHPAWEAIAPMLGLHPFTEPAERWVAVDPDQGAVRITLPDAFAAAPRVMAEITRVLNNRLPGGPWVLHLDVAAHVAEYRRASERLQPVWEAVAPVLGLHPLMDPAEEWLDLPDADGGPAPAGDDGDEAAGEDAAPRVALRLPEGFRPTDPGVMDKLDATIRDRVPGGPWKVHPVYDEYRVEWRRVPRPPRRVELAEIIPRRDSIHEIPVGKGAAGKDVVVSMLNESPHWMVIADSGRGKTSTLRLPIAHVRQRGGLVDVIDLKITSFNADFRNPPVPGVRVHTDMDSAVWALAEFYLSMLGVNMAIDAGTMRPEDAPQRYLVIDEFGSLMRTADMWWAMRRQEGKKGPSPFLNAFTFILYQGRQAEHRMIVGVHTPMAGLFGSTDQKNLFATRIMLGSTSPLKWYQTFGKAPRIEYDGTIDGRGVIGYGDADVQEVQVAWLAPAGARARAEAGPPAPGWFDRGELPPWVSQATLDRAAREVGIDWLSLPAGTAEETASSPAHMRISVPGRDTGEGTPAPAPDEDADRPSLRLVPPPPETSTGASEAPVPAPAEATGADDDDDLVVGLEEAARCLGYKLESFRKARQRAGGRLPGEVPGETREDRRPAFHRSELLAWHASRKITGRDSGSGRS